MKVLFLDIDGVLNNNHTSERCLGYLGVNRRLSEKLLSTLKDTGVRIVLSSTWRNHPEMHPHLNEAGIEWIDITPDLKGYEARGEEIKVYLQDHPEIENYAILDDMDVMLPEQKAHFVHVAEKIGVNDGNLSDLRRILEL